MKTNYQNLTAFDTAAVGMVMLGLALIGLQVWVAMPDQARTDIVNAAQILDMREPWEAQMEMTSLVFGGIQAFYAEFYVASADLFRPVGEDIQFAAAKAQVAFESFSMLSDAIALNYQVNYAQPGVEAGMGGKVLGAYIDRLSEHAASLPHRPVPGVR